MLSLHSQQGIPCPVIPASHARVNRISFHFRFNSISQISFEIQISFAANQIQFKEFSQVKLHFFAQR